MPTMETLNLNSNISESGDQILVHRRGSHSHSQKPHLDSYNTITTEGSSTGVSTDEEEDDGNSDHDFEKYDWSREKQRKIQFFDDGTMSFFWRAHTLTVLFLMIGVLIYVSFFETEAHGTEYNMKRGMVACVLVFILLGVTIIPDGPFLRPHPAFWRLMFCVSILYQLSLIFILFQSATDARSLLKHIDPKLGSPLEEKSYGGSCLIYDASVPADPFHNVWDKLDLFVPTHFFGWWLKTLVLRDWWLCTVVSIMFEILEYTLEHQLPNFSECWWDHWIMDALVCNGLGIYVGIKTLKHFQVKTYYWRGLWNIPGYRAKLKRIFGQFGPHTWIEFDWKPTSSLGRWISVLGIILLFLLAELNTFYLKFVLWVPHGHWLNLVRLFGLLFIGAVSLRETFQYLDDPDCTTFGRQSWINLAIVCTEFLIVAKFDPVTITKPVPTHISLFWLAGISSLLLWTIWNFGIYRRFINSTTMNLNPSQKVQQLGPSKSEILNNTHPHFRHHHHSVSSSSSVPKKSQSATGVIGLKSTTTTQSNYLNKRSH